MLEHLHPHLRHLPVYQPGRPVGEVAREHGIDPDRIVKLASNENPLGPSPAAIEAMRQGASSMHLYPDGNAHRLRDRLCEVLDLEPANIILGNGSNELIELAAQGFLGPGRQAMVSQYGFAIYTLVARLTGAEVITVPARDHGSDTEAMVRAVTPRTRVVYIAEPNNPTGTLAGPRAILRLIQQVPPDVLLVIDEAYREYLEDPQDLLPLIRRGEAPNLLILRTFSKIHGLAGLRLGYGLGACGLVRALERLRQPFNVNAMAQEAGLAALRDDSHANRSRSHNRRQLQSFEAFCRDREWTCLPSSANFVLLRVEDGAAIFDALLREGVITRPMGGNGLPEWIRITMGTGEENRRCMEALSGLLP